MQVIAPGQQGFSPLKNRPDASFRIQVKREWRFAMRPLIRWSCLLGAVWGCGDTPGPAPGPVAPPSKGVATGDFAIKPQFRYAAPFSEGVAPVEVGADSSRKWGYIDKSGQFAIAPQFDDAWPFASQIAIPS